MRTLSAFALVLAILVGGVVVWYKTAFPTYSYRYRLTVAIEVDGKVHTGSSVIEILWVGQPNIPEAGSFIPKVRGQAAFVDLGSGGAVIAALGSGETPQGGPDGSINAMWFAAQAFGNTSTNKELPNLEKLSGRRDLTPDNMPRLIWFSNIADPKSAKRFFVKDIPVLFGPTARLAAAYVEITNDRIVIDIDRRLRWYEELKSRSINAIQIDPGFRLTPTMFIGAAT